MVVFNSLIVAVVTILLIAYAAWRSITISRTPQGAVGWVVFLISAPWIALPAWFVLGDHKYRSWVATRRKSRKAIAGVEKLSSRHRPDWVEDTRIPPFEKIAQMSAVRGNALTILKNGEATFAAIFAAIDAAEAYVCVQFYTIKDDALGQRLQQCLIAAAGRGVEVRVIYDAVGSYGLPRRFTDALRSAGAVVVDPRNARGPRSRLNLNFRNHRKTVIVDGRIGFLGGHNVSELYLGGTPGLSPWRDTHLAIRGPVVNQLQVAFAEDWHWATGETLDGALLWDPELQQENKLALIVPTGPGDVLDTGALLYFSAISVAERRVWIASPYFVPDNSVLSALTHAALRGLDVRILLPETADHYLPWLAAFAYFDEMRAAGVRIFRYGPGFMHQKAILIDDDIAAIGTTNLDNRSFRLNFEAMAVAFDTDLASEIEAMLSDDMTQAVELETSLAEQPLKVRIGAPLARLLAPIL